jgi:hypothetical protein
MTDTKSNMSPRVRIITVRLVPALALCAALLYVAIGAAQSADPSPRVADTYSTRISVALAAQLDADPCLGPRRAARHNCPAIGRPTYEITPVTAFDDPLITATGPTTYTITSVSRDGTTFTLQRLAGGKTLLTCAPTGASGCPNGTW